ncbi:MAG: transcription elongation factor GreA [Acholeplasmatales bacterium]|nr:transcription elongation factor GreA [Acholeplasmatales bacterium]
MENKKVVDLTTVGKQELEEELERRVNVDRERIKQALKEARDQGDLSENADYSAAREDQSANESRILEIQNILKYARIVDIVNVEVEYVDMHKTFKYQICGSESDPFNGKISNDSPLAKGCLSHAKGQTFTITTENGSDIKIKLIDKK